MIPATLRGRLTCSVPEAGQLLSLGRDASYAAVARGEIPSLRLGRRLVVPVPKLLELVGLPQTSESASATDAPIATADPHGATHDDQTPECSTVRSLRNVAS